MKYSDIGFILEVDLEYPQELHESHRDYPLAPTNEVVPEEWLSEIQRDLVEQMKAMIIIELLLAN